MPLNLLFLHHHILIYHKTGKRRKESQASQICILTVIPFAFGLEVMNAPKHREGSSTWSYSASFSYTCLDRPRRNEPKKVYKVLNKHELVQHAPLLRLGKLFLCPINYSITWIVCVDIPNAMSVLFCYELNMIVDSVDFVITLASWRIL